MHLAIILDGNRRWARARGLPKAIGHRRGIQNFKNLLPVFLRHEISTVTAYALSTENLKNRDERELKNLFLEIEKFAADEKIFHDNEIRFTVFGCLEKFPASTRKILGQLERSTEKHSALQLNLALGYGGRDEIVRAARDVQKSGKQITEKSLAANLDSAGQPDPDLLIRTGGSVRISNFLIWQLAYAEFYFTEKMWPEFDEKELAKALKWFENQKRNFGK